jgi:hypothetical protein
MCERKRTSHSSAVHRRSYKGKSMARFLVTNNPEGAGGRTGSRLSLLIIYTLTRKALKPIFSELVAQY